MRYLGNKTRLLDRIVAFAADRGVPFEGVAVDVFAGTASVGRRLRSLGFRVYGNDLLRVSFLHQKAALEAGPQDLRRAARWIEELERRGTEVLGTATRQFSPVGEAGRRYFTEANARRIDGIIEDLLAWRRAGRLNDRVHHVLLAALVDAADRVANTSGVYAAYLKTWQPNARGRLALRLPEVPVGPRGRAGRGDAEVFLRALPEEADLLYVDPPYNHRQYAANYHVLEVLAEVALCDTPGAVAALEATLYGKTGMRPWQEERSAFSSPGRCEAAVRRLLAAARARHLVFSYNEEGILSKDAIVRAAGDAGFRDVYVEEVRYRRFRSDADGRNGRRYRVIRGRRRDEVAEWIIHANRPPACARGRSTVLRPRAAG